MSPEEANRLKVGDRIWVLPDSLLKGFPGGIYSILEVRPAVIGGKKTQQVRVSETVWVSPHHLGRVSVGQ